MTIAIPRLDRTTAADRGLTLADFLVPIPRRRAAQRPGPAHPPDRRRRAVHLPDRAIYAIPREPVPWTGQTFGVLVVGGALGARRGFAAVALYVLLGLVGLPFFAEGKGGTAVLLGPTGGYLIGFLLAGAIVGRLAELGWDRRFGGAVAMMLIGSGRDLRDRAAVAELRRGTSRSADTIAGGLTPFLVWDAAKLARRGRHLPGRLVAHRPAAGRPLASAAIVGSSGDSACPVPSTGRRVDRQPRSVDAPGSGSDTTRAAAARPPASRSRPGPAGRPGRPSRRGPGSRPRCRAAGRPPRPARAGRRRALAYRSVIESPAAVPAARPISRRTTHQRSSWRATASTSTWSGRPSIR